MAEPRLTLSLYDSEHVMIHVRDHNGDQLELILEDAALCELGQRRVSLRFEEESARRNPVTS